MFDGSDAAPLSFMGAPPAAGCIASVVKLSARSAHCLKGIRRDCLSILWAPEGAQRVTVRGAEGRCAMPLSADRVIAVRGAVTVQSDAAIDLVCIDVADAVVDAGLAVLRSPVLVALMRTLLALSERERAAYVAAAAHLVVREVQRGDAHVAGARRGALAGWRARRVDQTIAQCQDAAPALTTLAQASGLSPFHFSRSFKAAFGASPVRFYRLQRLEQAMRALEHPERSILDVALEFGYQSNQSFARAFKREFGLSPRDFRARAKMRTSSAPALDQASM